MKNKYALMKGLFGALAGLFLFVQAEAQTGPLLTENWSTSSYATNGWTTTGNWTGWTSYTPTGGATPNAFFNWTPSTTNYDRPLTSPVINAGNYNNIRMDYLLHMNNYSTSTLEQMAVEYKKTTDATWTLLENFTNTAGTQNYTRVNQTLTNMAGSQFQIRFRAYGQNSFNINGWGVDNILVKGDSVICSGTPNAGTTASTDTVVEPCQSFTLSMSTSNFGFGYTYQWQISTDNITWGNIVGGNALTYTTSQTSSNYYRCILACTNSGQSDTSASLLLTTATLSAGTAQSNDNTSDLCQTFTLSLSGATSGPTITYQWQSSPDNITWGNIVGATAATYASTQLNTTYYRCIVGCGAFSDTSTVVTQTTNPFTAGTSVSSVTDICPSISFNVSLSGNSTGSNTYQWQSSPDNTTWTNTSTAANYNPTQTAATYYRCIMTCGAAVDTSTAVYVPMSPFYNCYCANSNATSTIDEDIDTVRIGNFVNVSQAPTCGTYTNFFNNPTFPILMLGVNYPIGIGTRDCEGTFFYSRYVKVWIDYNHNGTYENPAEMVFGGPVAAANLSNIIGNFTVPPTALTGFTGMRVVCNETTVANNVNPCGTYTWGETEDYLVWINQIPTNDAGSVSLVSPEQPTCTINDTVVVRITNIGTDTLYTADINLSVNGGSTTTYNWSGALDSNQTADVNIGVFTLNDGDNLKIWTSNPNGNADDFIWNDTLNVNVYEALNGSYTVYGATPDYNNLQEAVDDLVLRGICGDVFFNIRSGNYTDQVSIPTYPLASAGNFHVTFQSEVLDATQVKFDVNSGSNLLNYVFELNGADNVILNEMTLSSTGTFSRVIALKNSSDNIEVRNSILIGDTLTSADNFDKIVIVSTGDNDDNLKVVNNEIWGGSRAISLGGVSNSNPEGGATIDSNIFRNFYFVGAAVFNQLDPNVRFNDFETNSNNGNVFRIYLNNVNNGFEVSHNSFHGIQPGFGINLDNASGVSNNPGLVANNFVFMGDTTGTTTFSEGIYVQNGSTLVDIVHNSVSVMNDNPTTSAISLGVGASGGANSIRMYNNNVVNYGSGLALSVVSNYNILASDNNNFYSTGTNVANYLGTNYTTVGAYSTASSFDQNSQSVDPNFVWDDLHTCRLELDNAGMPYANVTIDIDNDQRSATTPDIGADEYLTAQNFTLGNDTIKCPGDSVLLGGEILTSSTYYWSPYFQNTATIYATAPGTYVVQVASSCGAAVDTVVVSDYPLPVPSFTYSTNFYTVTPTNTSTNAVSYIWDFGDGSNTSTAFEPAHVYSTNGTYTITLYAISDCGDTVSTTQTVTVNPQFAGTDEVGLSQVNIYPNPSDGYFSISLNTDIQEDIQLVVTDLSGREVYARVYGTSGGEFVTDVDLRGMAGGTYILKLVSGKYSSIHKVIIK